MKPRVAISLCLLGEEVRHDGGHRRSRLATHVLTEHFEWAPVCPEVEVGMGIPREPIRLQADGDTARLVGIQSGRDWTDEMDVYATAKVAELAAMPIDGFILKENSPSCGMARVSLHDAHGVAPRHGVGAFARVLMRHLPTLPVEEEERLHDARRRADFITRVYAHQRRRNRN